MPSDQWWAADAGRAEGHESGGEAAVLRRRWEAMTRGKARTRRARTDIMRANAARARKQAAYDRRQYDGHASEESGDG